MLIFDYEIWDDGDYIITANGKPIGMTVSKKDGIIISNWLKTTYNDLEIKLC